VSFSGLILSLCGVHGRERPVWSCGVVEWIGRLLISPTPSPGHRQVTTWLSIPLDNFGLPARWGAILFHFSPYYPRQNQNYPKSLIRTSHLHLDSKGWAEYFLPNPPGPIQHSDCAENPSGNLVFFFFLFVMPPHRGKKRRFLICYAVTQLATQLQQRCIQVVCSNKEARKRLTESNGTPAMDLGHMNVVLK